MSVVDRRSLSLE